MLYKLVVLLVIMFLNLSISSISAQDGHDHDHDHELEDKQETEKHHKDNDDHDEHDDELTVQLTDEGIKLAGISISNVTRRHIYKTIELPGEIGFNEDRLAHISPRFAGIAQQANYRVGDYVKKGSIVAIIESNESMNSYSIKAPISGWVIERHITPGEYVSEENSIFDIADLSTVWVNLAVYPKDLHQIKKDQLTIIRAIGTDNTTSGSVEFVTPILDFRTRNATARVIIPNPDNTWQPGIFVQATIDTDTGVESLVVEKDAVQYLDEKSVVFVIDGINRFKPVEVVTGDSNNNYIQIIDGLNEGSEYVSSGAFELKAKIVTSNLDAHAGHGH